MDKRIILIAVLAMTAVILTSVRECYGVSEGSFSILPASKQGITGERIASMADTTLKALGIKKENIRPIRNRNDVRVFMPVTFDPLLFVRAMKDSLSDFRAEIISTENNKDKSSVVQIKDGEVILKSYLFSKEQAPAVKKGVSPSQPKKQIR